MDRYTLRQLRNTEFNSLYQRLICGNEISHFDRIKLLKLGIVFMNNPENNTRLLGYRIILKYCNHFKDYRPLYSVALTNGYVPIAKFIEQNHHQDVEVNNGFFKEFQSSFLEQFRDRDIYLTEEQYKLNKNFHDNNSKNIVVVAPTSYGKSELIVSLIKQNRKSNICILVPTKSLLAQTRRRILKSDSYQFDRKILTHQDMYNESDKDFIAVLTQERVLRLLQKNKELSFDYVIIDEAHILLEDDVRSRLLASAIILLNARKGTTTFKYLTPFLKNEEYLNIDYTDFDLQAYSIDENIKSENYYYVDLTDTDSKLKLYDQYLDKLYTVSNKNYDDEASAIIELSGKKNIIYLNKPSDIEHFAKLLASKTDIIDNDRIYKASRDISEYVHGNYNLIYCLRRGILYHHGSVPDNIRLYIENLFSTIDEVKYIITSSTLLQGVNIPAEKMFILDYCKGRSKLSHSQLRNLSGRVSRFSEIFHPKKGSLKLLEPNIVIVKSSYMRLDANIPKFLKDTLQVDLKHKENVANVLLSEVTLNEDTKADRVRAENFLENQSPGITGEQDVKYAQTEIGKICFLNNITEIDILEKEYAMQKIVDDLRDKEMMVKKPEYLLKTIRVMFISYVDKNEKSRNITRLKNDSALNFYNMFIGWKIKQESYKVMINSFIRYWERIIEKGTDTLVYVDRWGDTIRENPNMVGTAFRKLWTDIKLRTPVERINLAIVRIKEEQDFIENNLMKFIEVINDLELLDETLYYQLKYGTTNMKVVTLIKNGIGFQTAKLIVRNYIQYVTINIEEGTIFVSDEIIEAMKQDKVNDITIYEVSGNVK